MAVAYLAAIVLLATPWASAVNLVPKEYHSGYKLPAGYRTAGLAADSETVHLTFALKQENLAELEASFWAVSDPRSARYGQHMTMDEVNALTKPSESTIATVVNWLVENGITNHEFTRNMAYLDVEVSVEQASRLLATVFHHFEHIETGEVYVRSSGPYYLPASVAAAVDFVGGVVRLPPTSLVSRRTVRPDRTKIFRPNDVTVVPSVIKKVFNIPPQLQGTNKTNSQAVNQFLQQYYDPEDLSMFQEMYKLVKQNVTFVDGFNDPTMPGLEAALDIEYMLGITTGVDTWFISTNGTTKGQEPFLQWITKLVNSADTPYVLSVSYGDTESSLSRDYTSRINVEFQKLGAAGRSVLFSSGDDGVGCNSACDKFEPNFPASSPFVTSVGGVVLQDVNSKSMTGDEISSGGFSDYFGMEDYQLDAVNGYVQKNKLPNKKFWNATGRAFPDISSFSEDVSIVVGGGSTFVGGTSCASPVVSAIITLVNDQRLNNGKPTMGFLNPFLYQTLKNNSAVFFDITTGSNPAGCCNAGFSAAKGWDPITGVGAPNFANLIKQAMSI